MKANSTTRKLEQAELQYLRGLVNEQHQTIEQMQDRMYFLETLVDQLQQALHDEDFATHRQIGITKSGETMVVLRT